MFVKATALGYFGNKRIRPGQVFELKDLIIKNVDKKTGKETKKKILAKDQFSPSWMEEVEAKSAKQKEVLEEKSVPFDFEPNVQTQSSNDAVI